MESQTHEEAADIDIDPTWTSSRTARQIYSLGTVEKDIARLLAVASSSISLLTLPQTDPIPSSSSSDIHSPSPSLAPVPLPQGEERSEQFVLEVSEYFERIDAVQGTLKDMLAHIKHARIAPSTITAPPLATFIPPSLGVGVPQSTSSDIQSNVKSESTRGLQEERIERNAWKGILSALQKLQQRQKQQQQQQQQQSDSIMSDAS